MPENKGKMGAYTRNFQFDKDKFKFMELSNSVIIKKNERKLRKIYDIMHCRGSMQSLRDCMEEL